MRASFPKEVTLSSVPGGRFTNPTLSSREGGRQKGMRWPSEKIQTLSFATGGRYTKPHESNVQLLGRKWLRVEHEVSYTPKKKSTSFATGG